MQKITTFLTYESRAEEAMKFYVSILPNARVVNEQRMGPDGPFFTGTFEVEGQKFHVLNGGPMFNFSMGISLFINCKDQQEIDHLWKELSSGGEEQQCGWVKDKFGVSWQIIPHNLKDLMWGSDPAKSKRVMDALMKMKKIDVSVLEKAAE